MGSGSSSATAVTAGLNTPKRSLVDVSKDPVRGQALTRTNFTRRGRGPATENGQETRMICAGETERPFQGAAVRAFLWSQLHEEIRLDKSFANESADPQLLAKQVDGPKARGFPC